MSVQDISPDADTLFSEDIRLIIWDLDETFWQGTLTEGGASINIEHVEIVKSLAARGIMSSICSKNDPRPVQELLEQHGVWDYFIFPNIGWEGKGPRIKQIIEQTQLRPASVLFVDDNPTNLAEVKRYVPDVNVASERFIGRMLTHANFIGKDDSGLSRLQQYKKMEQRHLAKQGAGSDPSAFLRESNITVEFVYDIKPHMERVIELVNRTNQLNFTKIRVSEDPEEAARQLSYFADMYLYQCALVRVKDAYGDHGFCGFYVNKADTRELIHFCFSCRILGLGIEQWIYEKLGRPGINIVGEVISDLNEPHGIDWINQKSSQAADVSETVLPQAITARGGCELAAVIHYFMTASSDAAGEYHFYRNGLPVRIDHTVVLHQIIKGLTPAQREAAKLVGFVDDDFETRLFSTHRNGHVVLLSFAVDVFALTFRHKASGFEAPVFLPGVIWDGVEAEIMPDINPDTRAATEAMIEVIQKEFEPVGFISEQRFKSHLTEALDRIPSTTEVMVLGMYEGKLKIQDEWVSPQERLLEVNRWARETVTKRSNVTWLRMENYAEPTDALDNHFHFHRMVYYRIYKALHSSMELWAGSMAEPVGLRGIFSRAKGLFRGRVDLKR